MKTLEEIIKELPKNIRLPIYEAFQVFKEDITRKELVEIKEEIKEVWKVIKELSEAQRKTEEDLKKLAESHYKLVEEHRKTRQELEGLSDAFGYTLEDRAIKSLPKILKEEYGIEVVEKLKRKY